MSVPLSQEFGYFWLSSTPIMAEMRSRGTGVAVPGLNSSAVKDLPVIEPPSDCLAKFDRIVAPLVESAFSVAKETRTLAIIRDTLLPRLISSEIRVVDAERIVEDAT